MVVKVGMQIGSLKCYFGWKKTVLLFIVLKFTWRIIDGYSSIIKVKQ